MIQRQRAVCVFGLILVLKVIGYLVLETKQHTDGLDFQWLYYLYLFFSPRVTSPECSLSENEQPVESAYFYM